jgi:hypothetical protein
MSPTSPRQPGAGAAAGARHAAFKVHRDSHSIHKGAATASPPSPSSTNSSFVSLSSNAAAISTSTNLHRPPPAPRQRQPRPQPQPQQHQPVIIYTHSPKVIRTNPTDFMSIVQKLTGLDSPGGGPARGAPPAARATAAAASQDESSSSSSESYANATHAAGPPPHYADSQLMPPPPGAPPLDANFMARDIPLFAPDASGLQQQLCAPRGLYGQFPPIDAAALGPVMSANVNGASGINGGAVPFSPSMVEAMRAFPDYN